MGNYLSPMLPALGFFFLPEGLLAALEMQETSAESAPFGGWLRLAV